MYRTMGISFLLIAVGSSSALNVSQSDSDAITNVVVIQLDLSPAASAHSLGEEYVPSTSSPNQPTWRHQSHRDPLQSGTQVDKYSTQSTIFSRSWDSVSSEIQPSTAPMPSWTYLSVAGPRPTGMSSNKSTWQDSFFWNATTATGARSIGQNTTLVNGTRFPSGGIFAFPTASPISQVSSSNSPRSHKLFRAIAWLSRRFTLTKPKNTMCG